MKTIITSITLFLFCICAFGQEKTDTTRSNFDKTKVFFPTKAQNIDLSDLNLITRGVIIKTFKYKKEESGSDKTFTPKKQFDNLPPFKLNKLNMQDAWISTGFWKVATFPSKPTKTLGNSINPSGVIKISPKVKKQ